MNPITPINPDPSQPVDLSSLNHEQLEQLRQETLTALQRADRQVQSAEKTLNTKREARDACAAKLDEINSHLRGYHKRMHKELSGKTKGGTIVRLSSLFKPEQPASAQPETSKKSTPEKSTGRKRPDIKGLKKFVV